ncbi:MAG: hypothetical protein KDB23_10820, partial [Planctomycetales bacterium]|nr:hypothetical protein [Planctomycetales bacterium]
QADKDLNGPHHVHRSVRIRQLAIHRLTSGQNAAYFIYAATQPMCRRQNDRASLPNGVLGRSRICYAGGLFGEDH